ncbi:bacillithiol biosynthesis cysteine-adding enzyme BshC [Compostibacter hankyongensis]|uniref:Putative cysteine ligase BshC n=1 Tax=Compostibacter hankyongensis TaxID=1007089 RepID=A0ABP8FP09_9BACT
MDCQLDFIDYHDTGYFSSLITAYLNDASPLRPFYQYSPVDIDFDRIITDRTAFPVDRSLLVRELQQQYAELDVPDAVKDNIRRLEHNDTFTVCTAHQPNIFTGYLYFIYKIVQAIRLAEQLKERYPGRYFVPVYYMGSEDNDLEELNVIRLEGQTLRWETDQQGAVGRMRTEGLEPLIAAAEQRIGINEHTAEIVDLLREAYLGQPDIQSATRYLVNALFGRYGLVVVVADTPGFKQAIRKVLEEELFSHSSYPVVQDTIGRLSAHYHAQAHPREINLFYLRDQLRERIVKEDGHWQVLHTDIRFTREALMAELDTHPERFSPNVILRGILQESILPDVAFIGGGGEIAYWLELKSLFEHHGVFYPLLLLRNSVLWVDEKSQQGLEKLGLPARALFRDTEALIADFVKKHTRHDLTLKTEYDELERLYAALKEKSRNIDPTLAASVGAAAKKALCGIGKIEHKLLRAEKKKFEWQIALIRKIKAGLFPGNSLQERTDNFLPYYAIYGSVFVDMLYESLDPLSRKLTIIRPGEDGI